MAALESNNMTYDLEKLRDILLALQKLSIKLANTPIPSGADLSKLSGDALQRAKELQLDNEVKELKESFSKMFPGADNGDDVLLKEVSQFIKDISSQVQSNESELIKQEEISVDKCPMIFANIVKMVSLEIESHQNKVEGFIKQISNSINSANDIAKSSDEFSKEHNDNISMMDQSVTENISDLTSALHESQQDSNLTCKLEQSISKLTQAIDEYKEREEKIIKDNEEKIHDLSNKLSQAKAETDSLTKHLQEQKVLARKDALTELPNRVAYYDKLQVEMKKVKEGEGQLYLAVADIDHFKKLNDTYGHLTGDNVLKQVAKVLRVGLQLNDFVGRYGGEEFVLLLRDRTPEKATQIIDNIRKNLQKIPFHYRSGDRNEKITITISIGLALYNPNETEDDCFKRADSALYEAKKTRNKVVFFE